MPFHYKYTTLHYITLNARGLPKHLQHFQGLGIQGFKILATMNLGVTAFFRFVGLGLGFW